VRLSSRLLCCATVTVCGDGSDQFGPQLKLNQLKEPLYIHSLSRVVIMTDDKVMLRLVPPYTMIVSGQTGSGKTDFVLRLIHENAQVHAKPFVRIIYCYSIAQDKIKALENVELYQGFPEDIVWTGENTLLVLDDLMLELQNDARLAKMFTKMRHENVSTIFLVQNLYFRSQYATTVTRNAQYLVLFANPRDNSMIGTLGRQAFPLKPKFLPAAFEMATRNSYGYLFLDFKPETNADLRVRQNIFANEVVKVYRPSP
jgi:hypothetical protein